MTSCAGWSGDSKVATSPIPGVTTGMAAGTSLLARGSADWWRRCTRHLGHLDIISELADGEIGE
jgi:hypothetical protein